MKFIKVDQELNSLKEKVKLQDPTKDIEVDNIKEKEIVPEKEPSISEMHGDYGAVDAEFTLKVKSKEAELSKVESKPDEVIPKNTKDSSYFQTRDDLLKCTMCDYKCKKNVTLSRHINTKNEKNNCNKCYLRFNNIRDLQNHVSDNHCDDIKDTIENKTNKEVEQEKCYDSRCSKCGYILFSEENIEDLRKPHLICKLCPILNLG